MYSLIKNDMIKDSNAKHPMDTTEIKITEEDVFSLSLGIVSVHFNDRKFTHDQMEQHILDNEKLAHKIKQQYKLRDDNNISDITFFLNIGRIIGEFDG